MSRKSVYEVLEKQHVALPALFAAVFLLGGPTLALFTAFAYVAVCCYKK
ncbi:MAG: hypothetical protein AB1626_02745 [Candidatus Micrarchaeota archaeon]